jgi:asparagine synthase (glutamine-hydrolysing)
MILGSFSIDTVVSSVTGRIRKMTEEEGLTFHPVANGGFSGGYYLHRRLPYSSADFYYSDEVNDIMVLMSGSIHNRSELISSCNKKTPIPDPELVADLFRNEGPGFVRNLNGDFTIFLLQPGKKQAYLFRDQVGIRPVGWTYTRQTLFFSSDIIALCRAFSDDQSIDSEYLLRYFKFIDLRKTPNSKVIRLLPGHYLKYSENGIEVARYWEPEKVRPDKTLSHDQMLSDLKSILQDAVRIRCDRRFSSGAHVSCGIDSGIVSTLARRECQQQETFYGFSWSPGSYTPGDLKFDERELVIKSCEKAGIVPVFSDMNLAGFMRVIKSFYYNHGYFTEDRTLEQAAELNTNLIFTGWGGDEFISNGSWAIELDLLRGLKLRTFFRRNRVNPPRRFIKNMLYYILYPALGILDPGTAGAFLDDVRYIKKPFKKSDRKAIRNFYFHTSRHQQHIRSLSFYHLQQRCETWAINGYLKGVEYRYPLLDKRIIEYMLKVPSELLCVSDQIRPLLREIGEGILPDEVRLNKQKNDPVYWTYMADLFRESAVIFMDEVGDWQANADLQFVDFEMLNQDIAKYTENSASVDNKVLFRALVYTKAIYDFIKKYRDH